MPPFINNIPIRERKSNNSKTNESFYAAINVTDAGSYGIYCSLYLFFLLLLLLGLLGIAFEKIPSHEEMNPPHNVTKPILFWREKKIIKKKREKENSNPLYLVTLHADNPCADAGGGH